MVRSNSSTHPRSEGWLKGQLQHLSNHAFLLDGRVTLVLPLLMLEVRYYLSGGKSPFADWFAELESVAQAKVTTAVVRIEQGNLSNVKSVGEGVLEYKIDFGLATGSTSGATATRW